MEKELVDVITSKVIHLLNVKKDIRVGVSARHVHLCQEDLETLFGKGYQLTKLKDLMGDEFAANETVTLISPAMKTIERVRVLGPVRKRSQVEISRTDTFTLKISPPVRPSGKLDGAATIAIAGPKGVVYLNEACIIANRHIHMTPQVAAQYHLKDNDLCDVEIQSEKPTRYYDVQVRVHEKFNVEMHIDTDDANAAGIRTGDMVKILPRAKE